MPCAADRMFFHNHGSSEQKQKRVPRWTVDNSGRWSNTLIYLRNFVILKLYSFLCWNPIIGIKYIFTYIVPLELLMPLSACCPSLGPREGIVPYRWVEFCSIWIPHILLISSSKKEGNPTKTKKLCQGRAQQLSAFQAGKLYCFHMPVKYRPKGEGWDSGMAANTFTTKQNKTKKPLSPSNTDFSFRKAIFKQFLKHFLQLKWYSTSKIHPDSPSTHAFYVIAKNLKTVVTLTRNIHLHWD